MTVSIVNETKIEKESKFYQYMYYTLVLFSLAANIAPAVTVTAIILGMILVVYHRVAFKSWPTFDKGLARAFGLYLGVWVIIALNSEEIIVSIKDVFATFYRIFPLFFVMIGLKNKKQLKNILLAFGVSVLITDVVAVYQYFTNWSIESFRPEGLSNHPIYLASHILMSLCVGGAVLLDEYFSRQWKITTGLLCCFSLLVLVATLTRGVWCALVIMAVLFVVLYPRNRWLMIKGLCVAALVGVILFMSNSTLQTRVQSMFNLQYATNTERILMWKSSIEMLKDYPIFGIGPNRFQYMYNTQYVSPFAREKSTPAQYKTGHTHPHNNFFKRLAEGGVVGGTAFILLSLYIFKQLYDKFKAGKKANKLNVYAMMGLVLFVGMHAAGLTDTNVICVPEMRLMWFLVGMFLVADDLKELT